MLASKTILKSMQKWAVMLINIHEARRKQRAGQATFKPQSVWPTHDITLHFQYGPIIAKHCIFRSSVWHSHTVVFDFSRQQPSAILKFYKFKILTADALLRSNLHHRAKCRAHQSGHCGDMAGFRFFTMAAVHTNTQYHWFSSNSNARC